MSIHYISLLIIAAILCFWMAAVLKITVFRYFKLRRAVDDAGKGRPINGTVISVTRTGRGKLQSIRMTVEFPNLSQTMVQEELRFIDSKPEENRYEEGRRVMLLIDDTTKGGPTVKLAGGKTVIGKGFLLLSALLLSGVFYGSWFIYKATVSKIQNDWSRVDELFASDDSMPMMGLIFIGVLIFQFFLFRLIGNMGVSRKKVDDRELKFYGEKAMAQIQRYEDTGVSINDNPKVKFHYSFTDKNGSIHQGEDAIVVGKLQIGLLPTMKEKEVFYLPQSPQNSKFTENLSPQSFVGCLNGVLIFEALIFSGIILGLYISGIL